MKKIEKLELTNWDTCGDWIRITDKVNEIVERLNQEVLQPEEERFAPYFDNDYRCPECQEELLVTCKHPLELYCTCCRRDINLGEMEEELTFVKETLPKRKTENNTEEWNPLELYGWRREFHRRFVEHFDEGTYNFNGYGNDAPCGTVGHEEVDEVIEFIEQLLSERSFSKEQLFELKLLLNDTYNSGNKAFESISQKVDRLLSLEKEK